MTAVQSDVLKAYQPPTEQQLTAARDLVVRFAESWSHPNADSLRDLMHPDTRNLVPPMTQPGDRETVVEQFRQVFTRLPDLRVRIVRWAPTDDAVLVEWEASASVAGQPISWMGVDRINIRGDRMYQSNVYWDTRGVAERLAELARAAQAAAGRA